jgi:divalent metal cation (Fe/Co/Zn/Cd) transporter
VTTRSERRAKTLAERIELPPAKTRVLQHAVRLEWLTIAFLVTAVTAMYLALGSSQAMKAAWIEDLLSFLPPIAFLVTNRVRSKEPTRDHPFGFHRSVSVGFLVSAVALLTMGTYLVAESVLGLVSAEHVPIGLVTVFGQTFWAGWLMIAALAYTLVPPVLLGRAKLKPASELHDKVLYADADMNKADWQTAAAGIVGVLGIGLGLWWLDFVAAIVIGASITYDGWKNLRTALGDLMDSRASVFDDRTTVHPSVAGIRDAALAERGVGAVQVRVREEGHVFHAEVFVVPSGAALGLGDLDRIRDAVRGVDWKLHHVVVAPVRELPLGNLPPS